MARTGRPLHEEIDLQAAQWRYAVALTLGPPTAAAVGKHSDGIPVGSAMNNAQTIKLRRAQGTEYRLVGESMAWGGAADPTSTVRFSIYEVASRTPSATGFILALGAEVVGSHATPTIAGPRGTVVAFESAAFTLDPAKMYCQVHEIIGAALPASVQLRVFGELQVRG